LWERGREISGNVQKKKRSSQKYKKTAKHSQKSSRGKIRSSQKGKCEKKKEKKLSLWAQSCADRLARVRKKKQLSLFQTSVHSPHDEGKRIK